MRKQQDFTRLEPKPGSRKGLRDRAFDQARIGLLIAIIMIVSAGVAGAQIANGSFESGYSGWTLTEAVYDPATSPAFDPTGGTWGLGADLTVLDSTNPFAFDYNNGISVLQTTPGLPITWHATDGSQVAFHLQNQSGRQTLSQDFFLPAAATHIAWDMQYTDHLGAWDPFLDNFVAVNLIDPATNNLLAALFRTRPGIEPPSIPMTAFSVDVSAFAGSFVRIEVELKNLWVIDLALDHFRVLPEGSDGGGTPPPTTGGDVTIQVRDSINPRSHGVVAVALLGTADFDPTVSVDVANLTSGNAHPVHGGHHADVNGDGFPDLLVHFEVQQLGLNGGGAQPLAAGPDGGSQLCLSGEMTDASTFEGCAPVQIVGGGR